MANDGNGENPSGAPLFEAGNKLRGSVESSEYKHLVLGLIFLKYISDILDGLFVDAGRATIGAHQLPRALQNVPAMTLS